MGGSYLCLFAGLVSPDLHQTLTHLLVLCLPPLKCVTRAGTLWLLRLHNQPRAGTEQVLNRHLWSERNRERRRAARSRAAVTRVGEGRGSHRTPGAGGLRPPQLTQQGLLYTRKRKPKTPRPRGEVLSLKPHGMRLNKQSKLMTLLEVHAASEMWATQIPQDDN